MLSRRLSQTNEVERLPKNFPALQERMDVVTRSNAEKQQRVCSSAKTVRFRRQAKQAPHRLLEGFKKHFAASRYRVAGFVLRYLVNPNSNVQPDTDSA